MKKTSAVFLKISSILGYIAFAGYLIFAIVFVILAFSTSLIVEGIQNGTIKTDLEGTPEEIAAVVSVLYGVLAFVFVVLGIFCLVSANISKKARNDQDSIRLMILSIVFGAISSNYLAIPGGIIGLIAISKDQNKQ